MRTNTINLQIVRNLGNYESIRIGAEWTPDSNQTLAEAMAAGLAELNDAADILMGKKEPTPEQKRAEYAKKGGEVIQKLLESQHNAGQEAAANGANEEQTEQAEQTEQEEKQPDQLDQLNMQRENDQRELLTLATAKKFNGILGRLAAGVEIGKVFEHFRFGEDALAILRAATKGERVTLAFGDAAFEALIKAIEAKKDIANICNYILLADENTANAWNLAIKMCNGK